MNIITDSTVILYVLNIVVSLYGFFLFAWWWYAIKSASEVYIYVMLMFLCNAIQSSVSLWARYNFFHDADMFESILFSRYWPLRLMPGIVIVSLITFRMTQRARLSLKMSEMFMKSVDDCSHDVRNSTMGISSLVKKAIKQIRKREFRGAIETLDHVRGFLFRIETMVSDCHVNDKNRKAEVENDN